MGDRRTRKMDSGRRVGALSGAVHESLIRAGQGQEEYGQTYLCSVYNALHRPVEIHIQIQTGGPFRFPG